MGTWGLFYVGSVLFMNALLLMGKVEKRGAAIYNLLVGSLVFLMALISAIRFFPGDPWALWNSAGSCLFAFTYLMVGFTNLKDYDGRAVGWYCLWVSIVAIPFAITTMVAFHDFVMGPIWLSWSYLWFLFFLLMGLDKNVMSLTIWSTHVIAWVTCTIPAYLTLIHHL